MSKGPNSGWVQLVFAAGVVLTLASLVVCFTFLTGNTAYLESVSLANPKGTPGQVIGIVVLSIFVPSMCFGLYWYKTEILDQLAPFQETARLWEDLMSKFKGRMLEANSPEAIELVDLLNDKLPATSRLGRAARSWKDPSPDSDAEMLIEGQAERCRQNLSLLQSIASILVLIGLVGNFFGLSEAVKELPKLISTQQASATNTSIRAGTTSNTTTGYDSKVVTGDTQALPQTAQQSTKSTVESISKGLSVVVVSSVLGIGGMILLLLFVSFFRTIFSQLVSEEVMLLATEIGAAVRPSSSHGESQVLDKLNTTLQALTAKMAVADAKEQGLNVLTQQLDSVLKRHLESEDSKFGQFHASLEALRHYLEAENASLSNYLDAAARTGVQLDQMGAKLGRIGDSLVKLVETNQSSMADISAYAELVRGLAEEDRSQSGRRHEELVESLSERMDKNFQNWLAKATQEREGSAKLAEDLLRKGDARHSQAFDAFASRLDSVSETITIGIKSLGDQQKSGLDDLTKRNQEQFELSRAAWTKTLETISSAVEESQSKNQQSLNDLTASIGQSLTSLTEGFRDGLVPIQASVQAWLEAAQAQQAMLVDQAKEVSINIKEVGTMQEQTATSCSAILAQGQETLLQARQKVLELQDRWIVSLEGVASELFTRWSEAQASSAQAPSSQSADVFVGQNEATLEALHSLCAKIDSLAQLPERTAESAPQEALLNAVLASVERILAALEKSGAVQQRLCRDCGFVNRGGAEYCASCGCLLQAKQSVPPLTFADLASLQSPVLASLERLESSLGAVAVATPAAVVAASDTDGEMLSKLQASVDGLCEAIQALPRETAGAPLPSDSPQLEQLISVLSAEQERLDRLCTILETELQPRKRGWFR